MPKTCILGIDYDNVTIKEAALDIIHIAKKHETKYVVTPNPEISESCIENKALLEAVRHADYVVPDGIGVVFASRIIGVPLKERVGGYDLACEMLKMMAKQNMSLYLLGSKPHVVKMAAQKMQNNCPGLVICGMHDGYFDKDDEIIEEINRLQPDVVFVAMGSPRQEIWMYQNLTRIQTGVMMGLGGSLDVFAGVVKRAPRLFQRLYLEWFYRLLRQPYRIKRMTKLPRYLLRSFRYRCAAKSRRSHIEG